MHFKRILILVCLIDLAIQSVYGQDRKYVETSQIGSQETKVQSRFQTHIRPGLQNVFQISDQLISGSDPAERRSFESLKNMGVKMIVSVDGTKPNLKLSREFEMRYVHIPIGYDGISEEAGLALARLAKEVKGPLYIHCHHGRHRGPTATAFVGLCQGSLNKKQATLFLSKAGTSKDYPGLWREIKLFQVPSPNARFPELVESAQVSPMVTAMSQISYYFTKLEKIQERDTREDKKSLSTIILLREEFHETARVHSVDFGDTFTDWLSQSERHVNRLETAFKKRDQKQIVSEMKILRSQCKRCHHAYRD